jgi:hypothetical protein
MAHKVGLIYILGVPITSLGLTVIGNQTWYKKMYKRPLYDSDIQMTAVLWPVLLPMFAVSVISSIPNYYLGEKYYKKER